MKRLAVVAGLCVGVSAAVGFLYWFVANGGKDGLDPWDHLCSSLVLTKTVFWLISPAALIGAWADAPKPPTPSPEP